MASTKQGGSRRAETVCAALKHPMRVRILEALDAGPRSPSQFVEEGLVPSDRFSSYQQALSLVSYHFRQLEKEGCVEITESIPRRGAVEHVYRSRARVYLTDAEFDELPRETRSELSRITIQALVARLDNAVRADSFDARSDRHLSWQAIELDERGWEELTAALAACLGEVEQIRHDAGDRLAASGEPAIPVTVGMVGFESPPPPAPPRPSS